MVFIRTDRAPICVWGLGVPLAFPAYVFTGYPYFGRETRPFLFSKNYLILGATVARSTTLFSKNRENACGVYGTRTRDLRRDRAALLTN